MSSLPTGTVTFLFTDIEGSMELAQEHRDTWEMVRARHHAILRAAMEAHNGAVFQVVGDAFCVAFHTANDALSAALDAQRRLQSEPWGETPIKVRMGINTGAAQAGSNADGSGGYTGYATMARTQRVMSTAYGEQILVSNTSADLMLGELPPGVSLRDMKEHRLKGLRNPEHLWQVVAPDLAQDFPALQTLNSIPNNLPLQLTSFVGREHQLVEVRKLLETHRLVTLTGSGGAGKTRLALQVASDILDQFPDGLWFVELAPISNPELIPQLAVSMLGLSAGPGRKPLEVLTDFLATKSLVIILDNCEHLLDACCLFADAVLHAGPHIKLFCTGREALGLIGEQAYRVPSLASPDIEHLPAIEQLTQFEAVRLFIERAMLVMPGFMVTNANAPAVAQICHRLDGIPLAIELAAARVKSLPLDTVLARLDDRFRLLTGGSRTALPRQQTLRAMIDWSYDLLSEPEKSLLQRLSVFRGGQTLEAAEAVCAGEGIEQAEILDLLSNLMDKSLLSLDEHGRYRMLETVRQYAGEKLVEARQAEWARDQHSRFMLELAEQAEPEVHGHDQLIWLDRLEAEIDNLRLALAWAQQRDAESFLRLASALWRFWDLRGYDYEGLEWLTKALALTEGMRTGTRARALARAGYDVRNQQDHKRAAELEQEAFDLAQTLDDKPAMAMTLRVRGISAVEQNRPQAALAFLEQGLSLYRELGDLGGAGICLLYLGIEAANRNDFGTARPLMEQGLEAVRAGGDNRHITLALGQLGEVALVEGDAAKAGGLFEEALALGRKFGDRGVISGFTSDLGRAALLLEDYARAGQLLTEASRLSRERGNKLEIAVALLHLGKLACAQDDPNGSVAGLEEALAISRQFDLDYVKAYALYYLGQAARCNRDWSQAHGRFSEALSFFKLSERGGYCLCLEGFGAIALEKGQAARAARLYGARQKLRASTRVDDNYPFMVRERERLIAQARAQLGEQAFNAAWDAGQAMSEEEMLAYALEQA